MDLHQNRQTHLVSETEANNRITRTSRLLISTCSRCLVINYNYFCASFTGSCIEAGYTSCCTSFNCMGSPTDCFCDRGCYQFGDCCHDIEDICNAVTMSG